MKRKRHGCLAVTLVLILLCGAMVTALPWILSTNPGRRMVLGAANDRVPGEVEVDRWRLSWTRGVSVSGLRFAGGSDDLPDVEVAGIQCEHGLLGFARNYPDLGSIEVVDPVVRLPAPRPEAPEAEDPVPDMAPGPPTSAPASGQMPAVTRTEGSPPELPPLEMQLTVTGGRVTAAGLDGPDAIVVQDLEMDVALAGPEKASTVRLSADVGDGAGRIDATSTLVFPEDGLLDPFALVEDAQMTIDALSLAALQPLLRLPPEIPGVEGVVQATLRLDGADGEGLRVSGDAEVAGLSVPDEDLQFGDVAFTVDATVEPTSARIREVSLASDFFNLSAQGAYGGALDGTFDAAMDIDLVQTMALMMHVGVVPTHLSARGRVYAKAVGHTEGGRVILENAEAVVTNLVIGVDERSLAQDEIRFSMSALIDPENRSLESTNAVLTCDIATVSFPQVTIAGPSDYSVSGRLETDLALVSEVAAQFSGNADAAATPPLEGELLLRFSAQSEGGVMRAQAVNEVRGLGLPAQGLEIGDVKGFVSLLQEDGPLEVTRATLKAEGFEFNGSGRYAADSARAVAELSCDLAALRPVLLALEVLPADTQVQGKAHTRLVVEQSGRILRVTQGVTEVQGLGVEGPSISLQDRDLALHHTLTVDLDARRIEIDELRLEDEIGRMDVISGRIDDWSRKPLPLTLEVQASADLGAVGVLLRELGVMKTSVAIDGQGEARLSIAQPGDAGLRVVADVELEDVSVQSPDFPPMEGEVANLGVTLQADRAMELFEVQRAELSSSPVELAATGSLSRAEGVRDIRAAGQMAADLDRVTALLQATTDMDLVMSGKETGAFRLHSRVAEGATLREALVATDAAAELSADRIDFMGMHLSGLSVPLTLAEGQGSAAVRGGVNEGALALDPTIDLAEEKPAIRLPEGTNALAGVQLTGEIADSLLGRIHPVFKGATVIGGTMGLRMDTFNWPLDPAQRNAVSFSGEFVFENLELAATGMLEPILEALKIRERSLSLGERTISFACENGRIRTSPTRVRVKGHELLLQGTMGLDQTLDYHAIVPITEELVGREVYAYLEGTTFRLPIRGTASKPEVNLASLQEGLVNLAAQAAQKALEEKAGELLQRLLR